MDKENAENAIVHAEICSTYANICKFLDMQHV